MPGAARRRHPPVVIGVSLSVQSLSPDIRRRKSGLRLEALQWLLVALVTMVALHVFAPVARVVPRGLFWAGATLAIAGLLLSNVAAIRLRRAGTPLESDLTPTALLTDGVFAWTRHPVYLGMLMLLAGQATMLGSVGALLTWPAFGLWLHWRYVGAEEHVLLATFGEAYERYRSRVRRWL